MVTRYKFLTQDSSTGIYYIANQSALMARDTNESRLHCLPAACWHFHNVPMNNKY